MYRWRRSTAGLFPFKSGANLLTVKWADFECCTVRSCIHGSFLHRPVLLSDEAGNTIVAPRSLLHVSCITSLLELLPVIFGGVTEIIKYLRNYNLLVTQKNCSCCGVSIRVRTRDDVSDTFSWWCLQCKTRKSIWDNRFFLKFRITLQKWLLIIYLWAREYPVTDVAEEADIDPSTEADVFQWLREVCTTSLLQIQVILGCPSNTVINLRSML